MSANYTLVALVPQSDSEPSYERVAATENLPF